MVHRDNVGIDILKIEQYVGTSNVVMNAKIGAPLGPGGYSRVMALALKLQNSSRVTQSESSRQTHQDARGHDDGIFRLPIVPLVALEQGVREVHFMRVENADFLLLPNEELRATAASLIPMHA